MVFTRLKLLLGSFFNGCIIFSVGERKFSPNAKFFAKK